MPEKSLYLRWAEASDAQTVGQLFTAHLRSLGVSPDAELDADMDRFPSAYEEPRGRFCLGVTKDGIVIGMGGILDGVIRRLHITPEWRGKHAARAIIWRLIDYERQRSTIPPRAIVARANTPAWKTFLACGFVPTGETPAHPRMRHCEVLQWDKSRNMGILDSQRGVGST